MPDSLLVVTVAGCVCTFYQINKTAAYLMVPYLLWLKFATLLNYRTWKDNDNKQKETK